MFRRVETIILLALCTDTTVNVKILEGQIQATWEDGHSGYFAVPKERVEAKLAELQQHKSCHDARLTVPNRPILPEILQPDEHVVAIAYGKLGAKSIEDSLPSNVKAKYETKAATVYFFIPFLTGPNRYAEPKYKLALGSFVSTTKPFIHPYIAIPMEQVDLLEVRSDGLSNVDANEVLNITWSQLCECKEPDEIILHDFEEYIDEFTTSFKINPDFSFCDEPGAGNNIYCKYRNITDCACQFWTHGHLKSCEAKNLSVINVTGKFKEVGLLIDGPQDAVLTEINEGLHGIGVQKHCVE
ncbi:hypothetical protein HOLleu_42821 [Holothuria leucospilota]|uniref:Uncharacterized protein n=1 Tax=Holothuria leucospilota TaxID=206669 RepID=A0A9Q0YCK4_HOLLE|nr:hypothetical protein HOLleu_42821 [Holothuria leucospilota]